MNQLPPHSRSNFITDDHLIIVGARIEDFTLESVINSEVKLIINLTEDPAWYVSCLPPTVQSYHCPIKNGRPPTQKQMSDLCNIVFEYYRANKRVYIHCNGGHGRCGVVGAVLIGKLFAMDAKEAIEHIVEARNTREDTSRNFVPTPETNTQVEFVHKQLGLKPSHILPDRSDRKWLARVKAERKQK